MTWQLGTDAPGTAGEIVTSAGALAAVLSEQTQRSRPRHSHDGPASPNEQEKHLMTVNRPASTAAVSPRLVPDRLARLDTLTLDHGSHESFDEGHCAMEVVAWLAGEGFTDAPACVSPVLREYVIALNDRWDHQRRQELRPYLPRLVGTAGDGQDEARRVLARRAVGEMLVSWLTLAGMHEEAAAVAAAGDDRAAAYEAITAARDEARRRRSAALAQLRGEIRQRLAVANAVAVAAADAVADADATADAVAVAVATADAAADAAADHWGAYSATYRGVQDALGRAPELAAVRDLARTQDGYALDLLDRMIDPAGVAS